MAARKPKFEKVPYCAEPVVPVRPVADTVSGRRLSLVRMNEKKWTNGTVLHYFFFRDAPWGADDAQMQAVRDAFKTWKNLGIGLEFEEVHEPTEAEIRIGFDQNDGSWSYVGRDNIDYWEAKSPDNRTMNFGWDLTTPYGHDTALHEIGHAMGFPHEHQNPMAGIVWDEPAVLEEFSGPPNSWPEQTIRHNILRKLPFDQVSGSPWDRDSIMHYRFAPGLILKPEPLGRTGLIPKAGLSDADKEQVRHFYPPMAPMIPELDLFESRRITLEPSEQADFRIKPQMSRSYTLQTFGQSDAVLVLFTEEDNGDLRYVAGDDDSGSDRNAKLEQRLERGRSYVVRVRLYWSFRRGETAVMYW